MAEYINRRKAAEVVCKLICGSDRGLCVSTPENCQQEKMLEFYKIQAEDVAPVVHSRLEEYEAFPLAPSMNGFPCGNCGMHFSPSAFPIMKYCTNCGAKLDGGE